ncbi:MAG: SAM-dependent methyltransferase [Negativicutes bacterium]|jgi:predicted SAM-dependent methyltransferase
MNDLCVIIGASKQNYQGWLSTQREQLDLLIPSDWEKMFGERKLAAILSEHVWEHLNFDEGVAAAKTCYQYLRSGGYVRCAVPDGYFPDEQYQKMVQIGGPGPVDHPAASHVIVHNYQTLKNMFEAAGFVVKLLEYWDETGEFHYRPWAVTGGYIGRSLLFHDYNKQGKIGFTSLLVDAVKE